MTGRVLVTVHCPSKGHRLAKLLATPDGLYIDIPHMAVGHAKGTKVVNRRGGPMVMPLLDEDGEPSMSYIAVCGCGHGHPVSAGQLASAHESGESVLIARAIL